MHLNRPISPEELTTLCKDTLVSNLGIEFTGVTADSITARMPVDQRTIQPFRILHGGASLALAETLGSIASHILIDPDRHYSVGMSINASHIRPVSSGWVYGTAVPLHLGKKTHIWEIKIRNSQDQLVCISRLTMAILDKPANT